ncbi:MAG: hypothetical protein IH975_04290 [Nitrospinae bacterium]|nr:hypothetical protein [Nitrospinota bacterium]
MPSQKIEQYYQYFEKQLQNVSSVENLMYHKILLVTIFDTLGRARFPDIRRNKERFVRLIKECADWTDYCRVSLPQLLLSLQSFNSGTLNNEVEIRIHGWQYGRIYRLNEVDPEINEIIAFAETDNERGVINNSKHAALLYTYRNHLVHEFREPGYGMEISDDDASPYYHGMTTLEGIDTWELVYPIGFFMNVARSILGNLKLYLQDNNLDPYPLYEFGSIWRRS